MLTGMVPLLGQDRALASLRSQLQTGRVHHAQIFHGPPGVGKFTAALALARCLLCHDRPDLESAPERGLPACGRCRSCELLASLADDAMSPAHPDLRIVTKELAAFSEDRTLRDRKQTTIPVDLIRKHVIEPVNKSPQLEHGKVFIIDEAELMGPAAQNALLKTLEEPPPGTVVILVTSSEHRLLPTIRSRSQRTAFAPLDDTSVSAVLSQIGQSEYAHQPELLRFADGSPGRAMMALTYGLTDWFTQVLPAVDRAVQGQPDPALGARLHELTDTLAKTRVDKNKHASKEAANRLAFGLMASVIAGHARQRLAQAVQDAPAGDLVGGEALASPWMHVIDTVEDASALYGRNVNAQLVCEQLAQGLVPARA